MGNTGIGLSFDENALFYNPAGLVGVDKILVGLPFLLEVSEDSVSIVKDLYDLSKQSGSTKNADVVELLMGKRVHFRHLIDLNVIMPFRVRTTVWRPDDFWCGQWIRNTV